MAVALEGGYFRLAQRLQLAGADIDAPVGQFGYTALLKAISRRRVAQVWALLAHRADPNQPSLRQPITPLIKATELGLGDIVATLLDWRADPNLSIGDARLTALHVAAEKNFAGIARALLQAGADVDAPLIEVSWTDPGHPHNIQALLLTLLPGPVDLRAEPADSADDRHVVRITGRGCRPVEGPPAVGSGG